MIKFKVVCNLTDSLAIPIIHISGNIGRMEITIIHLKAYFMLNFVLPLPIFKKYVSILA